MKVGTLKQTGVRRNGGGAGICSLSLARQKQSCIRATYDAMMGPIVFGQSRLDQAKHGQTHWKIQQDQAILCKASKTRRDKVTCQSQESQETREKVEKTSQEIGKASQELGKSRQNKVRLGKTQPDKARPSQTRSEQDIIGKTRQGQPRLDQER